jgi:hypothetical protein
MSRERRLAAPITAAILALVTLGIFFVLQHYGPESAVRRFHQGALNGNDRELALVTFQDLRDPNVVFLRRMVVDWVRTGGQVRIGRIERLNTRTAIAEVGYIYPRGIRVVHWAVERRPEGWVVNAEETVNRFRRFMGV